MKISPCNKQGFFSAVKIENFVGKFLIFFLIFAPKIDCWYWLGTHNLCFGAKIREIGMPLRSTVSLYKSGV